LTLFSKISVGLQTLFPSSGADVPRPNELTSVVHLVHPYPSQASNLQTTARSSFTGTAAVTPFVNTPVVEDAFFEEWTVGHIGHTAAVASRVKLSLLDNTGSTILLGIWSFDPAAVGFLPLYGMPIGASGVIVSPMRPIIVPPGWQLQLLGDNQAAAYTVTIAGLVIRRSIADVPLHRG